MASTGGAPTARWEEAQRAEREFWAGVRGRPAAIGAIVKSLSDVAAWAAPFVRNEPGMRYVEIGIGPVGLGAAHFLRTERSAPDVIGVDPIALDAAAVTDLPVPLDRLVAACRDGYEHVVATGESTGLDSGTFDAAFLINMLDHVESPTAVLQEAARLLRPGGQMVLAVDVFSRAGVLKHEQWLTRRRPESILVRAHPHRFSRQAIYEYLAAAGLQVGAHTMKEDRVNDLVGRVREVCVLAQKPGA
jgi:SAM-dependent methyltransferase